MVTERFLALICVFYLTFCPLHNEIMHHVILIMK